MLTNKIASQCLSFKFSFNNNSLQEKVISENQIALICNFELHNMWTENEISRGGGGIGGGGYSAKFSRFIHDL